MIANWEEVNVSQEEKIARTKGLVEANSNEALNLWRDWSKSGARRPEVNPEDVDVEKRLSWEQDCTGMSRQIGSLDGRPIVVVVFWNKVNGEWIGFWEAVSEVVDYKQVNEWISKTFPKDVRRANAMNFHNAVRY